MDLRSDAGPRVGRHDHVHAGRRWHEITLRHANLPDDDRGREHKVGWTWYLDMLGQKFEKLASKC